MILECQYGNLARIAVALVIAVGELRYDIPQVTLPNRLTTQRAERLLAGCPAIYQDEFHVAPANANNAMRAGYLTARLKFEARYSRARQIASECRINVPRFIGGGRG